MIRRLAALLAALFIVPALAGSPPARATGDDKAATLLAKHRAFVGWQLGDGTFHSFRIEAAVTDEKGKTTESRSLLWRNLAFNEASTSASNGGLAVHVGFTGNLFWASDLSGFTTPIYGDLAKYMASLSMLRMEGTSGLPGTFVKDATVDGTQASVVRVTLDNAFPIDLYVNPDTGAYVQAVIAPGGAYETTYRILKYAEASPGKKIVSSYRTNNDKRTTTYAKIVANADVSDSELHPPPATATWTFSNTEPAPIVLTHDRFLVDAVVNGVKGRFILDTGADSIYLDDKFADRIKAPVIKNSDNLAFTVYEDVKTRMRQVDTLSIGGATMHNLVAHSQDFAHDYYRGLDAQGYDGLIGFDLFAGAVVKLDTYESRIAVLDPSTDLSTAPGVGAIVDLASGTPVVGMKLNKTIDVNAMLDTGDPVFILYSSQFRTKYHLNDAGCGYLRLELGPILYDDVAGCEGVVTGNYLLLGFDFLKHFDMIFDYPHGRMFFKPNQDESR